MYNKGGVGPEGTQITKVCTNVHTCMYICHLAPPPPPPPGGEPYRCGGGNPIDVEGGTLSMWRGEPYRCGEGNPIDVERGTLSMWRGEPHRCLIKLSMLPVTIELLIDKLCHHVLNLRKLIKYLNKFLKNHYNLR